MVAGRRVWEEQPTQRTLTHSDQHEKQRQMGKEQEQKPKQQELEAGKQTMNQQEAVPKNNEEKLSQGLKTERQLELNTNAAPSFTESSPPGAPPIYPQPHAKYKTVTPLQAQTLVTTLTPSRPRPWGKL